MKLRKYQRGIIQVAGGGTMVGPGVEAPLVSALANGDVNTALSQTCWAGVRFDEDGDEFEVQATTGNFNNNVGQWLDAGTPAQVWVERSVTSGSWNSIDPGTGRHQLTTGESFRVIRIAVGIQSVTGSFEFFDAASGGNSLQTTSSATYSAEHEFDPCPLCCFTPETPITLASGLQVQIKDVRKGDMVLVWDVETNHQVAQEVTGIITRRNRSMYRVTFVGGHYVDLSDDHPLQIEGKGPASVYPVIEYKDVGLPETLKVGDHISSIVAGTHYVIESIEPISYPGTVYTLENTLFYANGLLVY